MKVFFLVNAGRRRRGPSPDVIEAMRREFADAGVECRLELCGSAEEAARMVGEAARSSYDSLWVGGGDGSLHHVINSIDAAAFKSFAVVPMGTVNGLARALGVPREPVAAVRWLLGGEPVEFDVGRVGGHAFILYATIGFHAAVFHATDAELKKALGTLAFWAAGAREAVRAWSLPKFRAEMKQVLSAPAPGRCVLPILLSEGLRDTLDGGNKATPAVAAEPKLSAEHEPAADETEIIRHSGYSLVLSNVENFSGFGAVREGDLCDSSFLHAHLFPTQRLWPMMRFFAAVRFRRPRLDEPGVLHFRVSEVLLKSKHRLRIQVDGEPIHIDPDREVRVVSVPRAIRLILNRKELAVTAAAIAQRDASVRARMMGER